MRIWSGAAAPALGLALGLSGSAQAATLFVSSAGGEGGPVKAYSTPGLATTHDFRAFGQDATGARIGAARNADGRDVLVVGAGEGGQTVQVYDDLGVKTREFMPFEAAYTGGVRVAAGDVNGDGVADIVVGAGGSSGHVKVFDGATGDTLHDFFAFDAAFGGGVSVAVGDLTGDGYADVVVGAGKGGGPHVKVFSGATGAEVMSFFAFDPLFTGGVNVGVGRNALGLTLLVGALSEGGQVGVFDKDGGLLDSFLAFGPDYRGGVSVAGGSFGGLDSILVGALDGPGVVNVYGANRRGGPLSFRAFEAGGANVAGVFDAVPEPGTWALMILGFGAAGARLRRRRAAALVYPN